MADRRAGRPQGRDPRIRWYSPKPTSLPPACSTTRWTAFSAGICWGTSPIRRMRCGKCTESCDRAAHDRGEHVDDERLPGVRSEHQARSAPRNTSTTSTSTAGSTTGRTWTRCSARSRCRPNWSRWPELVGTAARRLPRLRAPAREPDLHHPEAGGLTRDTLGTCGAVPAETSAGSGSRRRPDRAWGSGTPRPTTGNCCRDVRGRARPAPSSAWSPCRMPERGSRAVFYPSQHHWGIVGPPELIKVRRAALLTLRRIARPTRPGQGRSDRDHQRCPARTGHGLVDQ